MSQEKVELGRQAFDVFNRRDLGAYLALMDAEWRPARSWCGVSAQFPFTPEVEATLCAALTS